LHLHNHCHANFLVGCCLVALLIECNLVIV
jgi:hypothetical protein